MGMGFQSNAVFCNASVKWMKSKGIEDMGQNNNIGDDGNSTVARGKTSVIILDTIRSWEQPLCGRGQK